MTRPLACCGWLGGVADGLRARVALELTPAATALRRRFESTTPLLLARALSLRPPSDQPLAVSIPEAFPPLRIPDVGAKIRSATHFFVERPYRLFTERAPKSAVRLVRTVARRVRYRILQFVADPPGTTTFDRAMPSSERRTDSSEARRETRVSLPRLPDIAQRAGVNLLEIGLAARGLALPGQEAHVDRVVAETHPEHATGVSTRGCFAGSALDSVAGAELSEGFPGPALRL